VINHLPNSLVDSAHYSKRCEYVIMNEIHLKIREFYLRN
jgi:hypothetical protein